MTLSLRDFFSVDPGWVSIMQPMTTESFWKKKKQKLEKGELIIEEEITPMDESVPNTNVPETNGDHPKRKTNARNAPPLTEEDGAARVLDPIFTGLNDNILYQGVLLKDFKIIKW